MKQPKIRQAGNRHSSWTISSHRRQNHTGGPILLLKLKDTYTAKEASVFPGTLRYYQIYLPAGFEKTKPAAFMVFQDGFIYQAPVFFDNLIAKKNIPCTSIRPPQTDEAPWNGLQRDAEDCTRDACTASL